MIGDIVPLEDGSVLLVDSPPAGAGPVQEGTLGFEVAQFAVEAIAGGVTFEVLRAIAARLVRRQVPHEASAEDVRDAVVDYLSRSGYSDVAVIELRLIGGHGWTVEGVADTTAFRAMSELSGRVVHVRLG